jgi:YbbR domain-containing protein
VVQTIRVSPSQVVLEVDRLVERSTPVVLDLDGDPPDGYRVVETEVDPRRVTVVGPASIVDRLQEIATEPVAIRPRAGSTSMVVPLRRDDPQLGFRPPRVEVRVQVEEILGERSFSGVPIEATGEPSGPRILPPTAEVRIRGPERVLRGLDRTAVVLTVDVTDLEVGTHTLAVAGQVPVGIEILGIEPDRIEVRLPPSERTNGGKR